MTKRRLAFSHGGSFINTFFADKNKMANILVINDLGKGFGHVARSGIILNGFLNAGHNVSFASNKLSKTERLFIGDEVECFDVPKRSGKDYGNKTACNYAEYLLKHGFNDPKQMATAIKKYHVIFKKSKADVVVLDHAPFAAVALRSFTVKTIPFFHVGNSYVRPPLVKPYPNVTPWEYIQHERLELAESLINTNIRAALKISGGNQVQDSRELFTSNDLLDTWSEFDHFSGITDASYIGPIYPQYIGRQWTWRTDKKNKVFAYLKEEYNGFSTLLSALGKCDAEVLCVVPTTDEKLKIIRAWHRSDNLHITNIPISIDSVIPEISAYVGNAGSGISTQMIVNGIPTVMVPSSTEHHLFCIATEQNGITNVINAEWGIYSMLNCINKAMTDSKQIASVLSVKSKYRNNTPNTAVSKIIRKAEELHKEFNHG